MLCLCCICASDMNKLMRSFFLSPHKTGGISDSISFPWEGKDDNLCDAEIVLPSPSW